MDRLADLIGDVMGLLELEQFRLGLLAALQRAVRTDWVSLNDLGPDPADAVVLIEPEAPPESVALFPSLAHENPLLRHYLNTGDGRPYRFSDVVSRDHLHALELYQRIYRSMNVEYQIAFMLPHERGRVLAVALSRGDHDFTDEERDLMLEARPFLIQAYRNAVEYTSALDAAAGGRAPDGVAALVGRGLTERQAEALVLAMAGLSTVAISEQLGITPRTVEKHLERAYRTLGVSGRSEARRLGRSP